MRVSSTSGDAYEGAPEIRPTGQTPYRTADTETLGEAQATPSLPDAPQDISSHTEANKTSTETHDDPLAHMPDRIPDIASCTCSYVSDDEISISHFAAYPLELARRCIKAGTSEHGACAACGAPFERDAGDPRAHMTGWRPTCRCADPRPPVPCVALDPFAGAGTTLLAAQRLGRRAVGIELNPDYARIIEARVGRQGVLDFAAEEAAG